jgi:hypothetical protein
MRGGHGYGQGQADLDNRLLPTRGAGEPLPGFTYRVVSGRGDSRTQWVKVDSETAFFSWHSLPYRSTLPTSSAAVLCCLARLSSSSSACWAWGSLALSPRLRHRRTLSLLLLVSGWLPTRPASPLVVRSTKAKRLRPGSVRRPTRFLKHWDRASGESGPAKKREHKLCD